MIRRRGSPLSPAAALAVTGLFIGAAAFAWTLSRLPGQLHRIEGRLENERTLARLAEREQAIESDLDVMRARKGQRDPAPDERLRAMSPESAGESGAPLEPIRFRDWTLRRMPINIPAIEPALLGRWIAACERAPSAWRLGSLKIVAMDPQGRTIRVETIWEYAEETAPAKNPGPEAGHSPG